VEDRGIDGRTYVDVTSTVPAIFRAPSSGTATAFHCSTNSKAPYVKGTLMDNGSAASGATYVVLLGKPDHGPAFGDAIAGVEDGVMAAY